MAEMRITPDAFEQLVAHCFDAFPLEGCGLLASDPGGAVVRTYGLANIAASAKVYELGSEEFLAADQDADENGLVISGVFHSHVETEAYPSATDIAKASVDDWHYVLVSFAGSDPVVRSFRIEFGQVAEEQMVAAGIA